MARKQFEFFSTPEGEKVRINLRGQDVLANPMINRGTAFTADERWALGLEGLLPARVLPIELQSKRAYEGFLAQPDDFAKYEYLNSLHDRNETLFFRLLVDHVSEMLPIVYTPTIGKVIETYSAHFHRPRGAFLSIANPAGMEAALTASGHSSDEVDLIVVTDSEGILGIGDQGIGGVAITIGKLAVYTAAAGIHPRRVLPVVLDTGTDNLHLLNDEGYLGLRHARVRGERYDEFVQRFVETASRLYPQAMIHFEDFGANNAHRVLEKYRNDYCAFNDDIQGTAAIVVAAVLSALRSADGDLRDQRIVIHGAGTAGVGIADLLCDIMVRQGMTREEARKRFWCLGSRGCIREGIKMRDFQQPYARPAVESEGWELDTLGKVTLADVVRNVHPTILIGTSAQAGCFTEEIVKEMAAHCRRPIIMPLSNPTKLSEAHPKDVLEWTEGRALLATGSPFGVILHNGVNYHIAQANNALVFPGIGLGVSVCKATRVTDAMVAAAAMAVAEATPYGAPGASVLPGMDDLRLVSAKVALAVIEQAQAEDLASVEVPEPVQAVYEAMWRPEYPGIVVD